MRVSYWHPFYKAFLQCDFFCIMKRHHPQTALSLCKYHSFFPPTPNRLTSQYKHSALPSSKRYHLFAKKQLCQKSRKKVLFTQRFQRPAHGQTEQWATYLTINLFYGITNVLHKKNTFSHCMRIFSHCMRTFSHAIRIFSHRFSHRIFKEASKAAYWPEGVGNGL